MVVVVARDDDSYPGQPCGADVGRTVHVDVTGLRRCCKEVNCSKGKSTWQTYVQSIPLDSSMAEKPQLNNTILKKVSLKMETHPELRNCNKLFWLKALYPFKMSGITVD